VARTRLRGLTVAELRIAIEAPPELGWRWPKGPLERFATSGESAHVHVGVRVGRSAAPRAEALRYDSGGGIFDVAQVGGDWVIALRIQGRLQRLARFDAEFRSGEVVVDPESFYARETHYPLAYPLDEVIFLHRLAQEGGILLHACGVARGRDALLFSGPSGAGKTTIAKLMQGAGDVRVLSDDRIAIRSTDAGFRAYGTPWHGEAALSLSDSAPLRAIHLIHHASGVEDEPLGGALGAAAVLGNSFAPFHDFPSTERTLELAARLASRVPILRLGFPKDGRVVSFAWGGGRPRPEGGATTSVPHAAPAP
jgi:hypothetical protein